MMTKIYRVTPLAALMALLLAAGCTKERPTLEEPAEPSGTSSVTPSYGTTYMSLSLRTGGGSSQSEDHDYNYQGDWAGTDDITSFAVYVVSEDRDEVHRIAGDKIVATDAVYEWENGEKKLKDPAVLHSDVQKWEKGVLTLKPWKTSPGKKTIYAFLNPPAEYIKSLEPTLSNKAQFKNKVKDPIPFQGMMGVTYTDAPKVSGFRPDPNIAKKSVYYGTNKYVLDNTVNEKIGSLIGFDHFDGRAYEFMQPGKPSINFYKHNDHIMCSGIQEEFQVADNVSESEVAKNRDNLAIISVRRVLAQAVATWDMDLIGKGIKGDPDKEKMELKGVFYQVLNYEPTFYPIAERTDKEWFNIKNTKSPSYGDPAPSGLIDFTTYQSHREKNNRFDPVTLEDERYFRYAIPVNKGEAVDPSNEKAMQLLLRQKVVLAPTPPANSVSVEDKDTRYYRSPYPYETSTVHWGGCYLTETTQPWGDGEDSGYRKGNTPFFAIIASFAIRSLPWDESALSARRKREAELQKRISEVKAKAEQAIKEQKRLEQQLVQEKEELANFELALKDSKNWGKVAEYTTALNNRDEWQEKYNAATGKNRKAAYKKELEKAQTIVNKLRKDYYDAKKDSDGYNKHIAAENQVTTTEAKIIEVKKTIDSTDKDIAKLTEAANKIVVDGVTYDEGDDITPITYAHGINRIYYSLDKQKFYLNYHDIPVDNRKENGKIVIHQLKTTDKWYTKLTEAIPAGAGIPTASQKLLDKFSEVLNGKTKAETLTADEQRAMDFYLYGRVAPDLVPSFKPGARKYDYIDLRLGYVEEYTAKHKDKVVNYEIMTRYRGITISGANSDEMTQTRLLMVYYAWVNPSTNNNRTWYSSPVLRNNIYHMHITDFSKMGLSGIPFVKRPDDSRFTYLHNIDPDEKVPSKNEHLPIQDPYMNIKVTNVGWGIHSYKNKL